jgi:hypothetical protein
LPIVDHASKACLWPAPRSRPGSKTFGIGIGLGLGLGIGLGLGLGLGLGIGIGIGIGIGSFLIPAWNFTDSV